MSTFSLASYYGKRTYLLIMFNIIHFLMQFFAILISVKIAISMRQKKMCIQIDYIALIFFIFTSICVYWESNLWPQLCTQVPETLLPF